MTEVCSICPTRMAQNASHLLGVTLGDVVPPEAQRHLLNAQRELLLAVVLTIEHNASRMSGSGTPAKPGRSRRGAAASRRPSRVKLE